MERGRELEREREAKPRERKTSMIHTEKNLLHGNKQEQKVAHFLLFSVWCNYNSLVSFPKNFPSRNNHHHQDYEEYSHN